MIKANNPFKNPSNYDLNTMLRNEYVLSNVSITYATRKWYSELAAECTEPIVAATITLKQCLRLPDKTYQRLYVEEIERLLRRICKNINRKVFGVTAKRFKHSVFILPAIEGGGNTGKRLHIHLAIGIPAHIERECFIKWFQEILKHEPWVYKQVKIESMYSDKWIRYITKQNISLMLMSLASPKFKKSS